MGEIRLSAEEADAVRRALSVLTVRARSGELGVLHGLDRFVSTNVSLRKGELDVLDSAARKLGLGSGIRRSSK